ncbi:MAG TPA: hypothetical protein VG737_06645, partial [Cyclobacteriaceae bacterium]|nr:hypothetical protein [Cyclobacteriaceae bacterium]
MSSNKLSRLLRRKLQKFAKLKQRLSARKISAGDARARQYSNYLVTRLHRLRRQIIELNSALRVAAVAGAVIFAADTADAQIPLPGLQPNPLGPFTVTDRAHNPL